MQNHGKDRPRATDLAAQTVEKCVKNRPRAPDLWKNPKKATKCLKIQNIWGLKKVAPESIVAGEKRCLAAQAPTVGFGG